MGEGYRSMKEGTGAWGRGCLHECELFRSHRYHNRINSATSERGNLGVTKFSQFPEMCLQHKPGRQRVTLKLSVQNSLTYWFFPAL